ncbi:MAG: hypothetical protein KBT48_00725 [Firmicutes bacterium]|nr:hypothetical protein [Bacillota bacterium]
MKKILFTLIQWTWALPQTLIGLILYFLYRKNSHFSYHGSVVTLWDKPGSISLGFFLFLCADPYPNVRAHTLEPMIVHEYGHSIQSLLLGPFYLLIIGLPSFLWANLKVCHTYRKKNNLSYFSLYTETWANKLGEMVTKEKSIGRIFID